MFKKELRIDLIEMSLSSSPAHYTLSATFSLPVTKERIEAQEEPNIMHIPEGQNSVKTPVPGQDDMT